MKDEVNIQGRNQQGGPALTQVLIGIREDEKGYWQRKQNDQYERGPSIEHEQKAYEDFEHV